MKLSRSFERGLYAIWDYLDTIVSNMTTVHWALFAVCIIGTGVLFLRGTPVRGV